MHNKLMMMVITYRWNKHKCSLWICGIDNSDKFI